MTTMVTIKASGPCYPAQGTFMRKGQPAQERMVASGEEWTVHVGSGDVLTVTEEYHPAGYPPKQAADAERSPEAAPA